MKADPACKACGGFGYVKSSLRNTPPYRCGCARVPCPGCTDKSVLGPETCPICEGHGDIPADKGDEIKRNIRRSRL